LPSVKPSKKGKAPGCVFPLLGSVALLFTLFYILLSSGSLGGLIHFLVLRFTMEQDSAVHVYGGSSNLFTSTRADSVIVTNDRGLRVAVYGADVKCSLAGYFLLHSVRSITADSLVIRTPLPSTEPPDTSLTHIFTGTMAGMVTRANTVQIPYGRIVDPYGVILVDSMTLDAEIIDIENIELYIRSASSYIPLFGMVTGYGTLFVDSVSTELDNFNILCPPGSALLSCQLNADSTFSLNYSGSVSTAFINGAPFATGLISGKGTGSIQHPLTLVSVSEGYINYNGLLISLAVDSILATREQCSLHGLSASTGRASLVASGELDFATMGWQGSVNSSLSQVDISAYFPGLPQSDISGSFTASGSGTAGEFNSGSIRGDFQQCMVNGCFVSELILDCQVNQRELLGTLQAVFEGGSVYSEFSTSFGLGFVPVAWKADLEASVANGSVLAGFIDPILTSAGGFTADVSGEGSQSAFTVNGNIGLNSFADENMRLGNASYSGKFSARLSEEGSIQSYTAEGEMGLESFSNGSVSVMNSLLSGTVSGGLSGMRITGELSVDSASVSDSVQISAAGISAEIDMSGTPADFEASGTLGLNFLSYEDISASEVNFSGTALMSKSGLAGQGGLSADTILVSGAPYSLSALFLAEPGSFRVDSLCLGGPGDLSLVLSGQFGYGRDSLAFSMDGIALTRAGKLRLISEGDLEFVSDSDGLSLDTLWLDLPSGEITADGWLRGDSLCLSAFLSDVDLAFFTSLLGLSFPVSGILGAEFSASGSMGDLQTVLSANIQNPTYDEWDQSDSLTVDIHSQEDSLVVDGIWTWTSGVRSGFRIAMDQIWDENHQVDIKLGDIVWLEAELTGVGDELFYVLPMPFKTNGASVSARVEYQRDTAILSAGVASRFDRLYLTNPGIEFPGVSLYMTYPDIREGDSYNGRISLNSGVGQAASLQSTLLLDLEENLPLDEGSLPLVLKGYNFEADFTQWETLLAGVGWMQISGSVASQSTDADARPRLVGKLNIDQATISMGGGGAIDGASGGEARQSELPLDISIKISGDRNIWFRTSYANVELSTSLDLSTIRGQLILGGDVRAVMGAVYFVGREFQITQGEIRILQTIPLGVELSIQAESRIRSTASGTEYIIAVNVTGDPDKPDITLSGTGPSGAMSDQDIVSLLTAGMTYGELQQFDSSALGNVAGNYLGQWLARSIRDDMGLDALQFTPDFSSDSTSLVVNAGKYVLPDLFMSYSSDVFSSDAGTIKAQYFFNRDFFLEGSTKSTLTGNQDPSVELHYTYRY
jgi:hypothetical protein